VQFRLNMITTSESNYTGKVTVGFSSKTGI
jgi:hypothetical protein